MIPFKQFLFITESFADAKTKWLTSERPEDFDEDGLDLNDWITVAISEFKNLKNMHLIPVKYSDIGYWINKPFREFQTYINGIITDQQSKIQIKQAESEKVFENENVIVVIVKTHNAAQKYGAGTKWCISARDTDGWTTHIEEENETPYLVIFKKNIETVDANLYKVAVMSGIDYIFVTDAANKYIADTDHPNNDKVYSNGMTIWEILRSYGIPIDIFTHITFKKLPKRAMEY